MMLMNDARAINVSHMTISLLLFPRLENILIFTNGKLDAAARFPDRHS